jgi:hypothetical protein
MHIASPRGLFRRGAFALAGVLAVILVASTPSFAQAENAIDLALRKAREGHIYDVPPVLDAEIARNSALKQEAIVIAAKIEAMLSGSDKLTSDFIFLCDAVGVLTRAGYRDWPKELTPKSAGNTSMPALEHAFCRQRQEASGEDLLNHGLKIMFRTPDRNLIKSNIARALKYFDAARDKGFDDPELYQALVNAHGFLKDHAKVVRYAEAFLRTNGAKQLRDEGVIYDHAVARFELSAKGDADIAALETALAKAEAKDHEASKSLLSTIRQARREAASASRLATGSTDVISVRCDTCFFCSSSTKLTLHDRRPGVSFSGNGSSSAVGIVGAPGAIAGTYGYACSWTSGKKQKGCAGQLFVSGAKRNITIQASDVNCEYTRVFEH